MKFVSKLFWCLVFLIVSVSCERGDHRCGGPVGNPPCGDGRCCSISGWCGGSTAYCSGRRCAYQCWTVTLTDKINYQNSPVSQVISKSLYGEMFKHMDSCPSRGFYTYDAFVAAASSFPAFSTGGDATTRRREISAFLAQISQLTSGKWSDSNDAHSWGLCHINTTNVDNTDDENVYCTSTHWPCVSGKKYRSRGPVQLTHNYNYGLASEALGVNLINDPDLVATDAIVSFKTAIWFWMTQHNNNPSCHEILMNANSEEINQVPSYGVIGDIIRSGRVTPTSIEYYKRYCDILGVTYGDHLNHWYDETPISGDALIQMPLL